MSAPDWSVPCPICGRKFDSMDSHADSQAMVRNHMDRAHAADLDAYRWVRRP